MVCLALLLTAIVAQACSVPVFRYALEHWKPDACQAVVFHRGPLTEAQRALVRDLGADGLAGKLHANLAPRTVDLEANPAKEMLGLWQRAATNMLPWVVVTGPLTTRAVATLWSGPLTQETIQPLLDSPARREITHRLAHGESAVWLLLESSHRDRDAAAVQLLETRLAYLASTLALPKLEAQDIANGLVSVGQDDLRLEFSLLRLARGTVEEQPFIQMLLGTEPDLKDALEPIVFPIFGRGRALYALAGSGIKRETIDQAATFLIGKCSCQVKEQNPGADLLFAADWASLLKAQLTALPDLPSAAELAKLAPVTVTITGKSDSVTPPQNPVTAPVVTGFSPLLFVIGCVVGAMAVGYLLWQKK